MEKNKSDSATVKQPALDKTAPGAGLNEAETKGVSANAAWARKIEDEKLKEFSRCLMNMSNLSGCFYPLDRSNGGFAVEQAADSGAGALPLPPADLWHGYGRVGQGYDASVYLRQGLHDVTAMRRIVGAGGFNIAGGNILDFGCSGGRMLRHFEEEAKTVECWGCDLHSAAIQWLRTHLSPPFHFLLNTNTPHLPFTDGYFNLVYAGSVFSHIGELDDAWFLELRRIIKPGGRLYFTFNDELSLKAASEKSPNHHWVKSTAEFFEARSLAERPWAFAVMGTTPWVQRVFYDRNWLIRRLGAWFDIVSVDPHVYGWQSAATLAVR